MDRGIALLVAVIFCWLPTAGQAANAASALETGFHDPPPAARLRCYWWWLNGHTDEQTITRDLEAMKANGYGGAILTDAGGADQGDNAAAPAGPMFGTPAWRRLFRHALAEASRLGLEISLNIQSGWNLGGPMVRPKDAAKLVTWSRAAVKGPAHVQRKLAAGPGKRGFYRDIAVLAYPLRHGPALPGQSGDSRPAISLLKFRNASREYGMSAPDPTPLLRAGRSPPGEADALVPEVLDLSSRMNGDGFFDWRAPAGEWEILRIGYTISGAKISTSSGKWQGLAIDYLDRAALETYWHEVVDPLLADARPYLGRSLKYLVTDSWELGGINWTRGFRREFRARRGYDPLPHLPVMAGRIIGDRAASVYFLNDLRRTVADLVAENHYRRFAELAARSGLGIHPESGGPHGAPIDALQLLGLGAIPQTEFWSVNAHRPADKDRFFIKEASSAAHIYGKTLVAAEGETSIGPQWEERIWDDLKPSFDQALCAGLNRLFWHTFTSSPKAEGLPGQEYFAGTHLNPNVTWWDQARGFLGYINRSQFLLQQGRPVADVLYYYGDQAPNFVRYKGDDPAQVLPGYDYDVTNEDVLLNRLSVKDGKLVLPDGLSYRLLALPKVPLLSLRALRKIGQLVEAGATVIGPKPEHTTGIDLAPEEFQRRVAMLWGSGPGRVIGGKTAREVLAEAHVPPDFTFQAAHPDGLLDYVHRRTTAADIYFVRNCRRHAETVMATFRVSGKQPELWLPDTGAMRPQAVFDSTADHRTRMPLALAPYGSVFVVFRRPPGPHIVKLSRYGGLLFPAPPSPERRPAIEVAGGSFRVSSATPGRFRMETADGRSFTVDFTSPPLEKLMEGAWRLGFTPGWGAPEKTRLAALRSWTDSGDPGIRCYSGTAVYSKDIELPPSFLGERRKLELDLGEVREFAQIRLNGQDLGLLWKKPFVVDITGAATPGRNHLEVRVTNLWPNRIIGDRQPGVTHRYTDTNIRKFHRDSPLLPSGLLGPVRIRSIEQRVLVAK